MSKLETESNLQLCFARKTLLLAASTNTLNIFNSLCEAFLAFIFPVKADAVSQVAHKSVSVQGPREKLGFARLQASMNVAI